MVDAQATAIEASGHATYAVAEAMLDLDIEVEELDDGSDYRYMATSQ